MSRIPVLPALVGAVALVALPTSALAQTSTPTPEQPATSSSQGTTAQPANDTPRAHLDKAKQALDRVETSAVSSQHASKLSELRREIAALDRLYPGGVPGSATGDAARSAAGREHATGATAGENWNAHLMAAQRTIDELLGEAPVGTAGRETEPAAGTPTTLDASVKLQLQEVRRHLTQFAATASGTSAMSGAAASSSAATAPATQSTAEPPQTQTQTPTSQTTTTQPTGASQAQVDAEAAREHLTKARESLAQLTALPEAQELQGETRQQVSQLISQFNTLITTKENWQESYTQVEQTLNSLLSAPAGGTPTGTTGTTAAGELDPALRTKLEEFRTHLTAFHDAAGAPTDASTGASAPQTGTMAGAASDAETHIAAIERIVNDALGASTSTSTMPSAQPGPEGTTGAAGQVTIDRARLEQIRTHLQQLRQAIRQ